MVRRASLAMRERVARLSSAAVGIGAGPGADERVRAALGELDNMLGIAVRRGGGVSATGLAARAAGTLPPAAPLACRRRLAGGGVRVRGCRRGKHPLTTLNN